MVVFELLDLAILLSVVGELRGSDLARLPSRPDHRPIGVLVALVDAFVARIFLHFLNNELAMVFVLAANAAAFFPKNGVIFDYGVGFTGFAACAPRQIVA